MKSALFPKLVDGIIDDDDDHWPGIEIDQLRQDLEEALMGEAAALQKHSRACDDISSMQSKYSHLKNTFDKKVTTVNHALKNKCMILLNLIDRYEFVLNAHMKDAGTFDAKIKHLRQKGELDV